MAITEMNTVYIQPDFQTTEQEMKNKGFWMRPLVSLEEKLIYDEEKLKTNLRTYGWSYHRNITSYFLDDIKQAYEHKQIFTCASVATQGFGKTLVMLAIAGKCQEILKEVIHLEYMPDIITSIGKEDTKNVIRKELVPNSIFFEDEDPFISGTDSIVTEHALQNLQEVVLRFNNITYLTAAVTKKRMVKNFFSCYLEPLARDDNKRKTYCRVYSGRTLLPLGHIIINILPDDNIWVQKHKEKERLYKEHMLNTGGYESVSIDPFELEKHSELLLQAVTGKKEIIYEELTEKDKKRIRKLGIERLKTAMSKLAYKIPGSAHQHKRIVDECWDKIMHLKIEIDVEEELQEEQLKEEKKKLEQEEKEQFKIEQLTLIESLLEETITALELDIEKDKQTSKILIKHYLSKKGIDKQYINYALGEIEERLFRREKIVVEEQKNKKELFLVNNDIDKFIFDEFVFLEQLRLEQRTKRGASWEEMIEVYQDREGGMYIQEIANKHNISVGSVKNYCEIITGKISDTMGRAYEQFRTKKLQQQHPTCKIITAGPNTKEPDIILEKEKSIELYSLKIRNLKEGKATETVKFIEKFKPEYEKTLYYRKKDPGKEIKMFIDFYNIYNHTSSQKEVNIDTITRTTRVRLKYTGAIDII